MGRPCQEGILSETTIRYVWNIVLIREASFDREMGANYQNVEEYWSSPATVEQKDGGLNSKAPARQSPSFEAYQIQSYTGTTQRREDNSICSFVRASSTGSTRIRTLKERSN